MSHDLGGGCLVLNNIYDSLPSIYEGLLERRTILLTEGIADKTMSHIIAMMLELEKRDPDAPIHLIISGWGGILPDAMAMYDLIKSLDCPVNTYALGKACSGAALILAAGTGRRYAYPSTRIMIHQPYTGAVLGSITDTKIAQDNDLAWKRMFLEALAESTGQPLKKVIKDCERDKWMSAKEALEYGIVDEIVELKHRKPLNK